MFDSETRRAWRKLRKEVAEDAPIMLRGLASAGKRIPPKLYSALVRSGKSLIRGCKSLTRRAKEWDFSANGGKALVAQLSRVRLRSPIYKA